MDLLHSIKARYPLPLLIWYMIVETAIARTAFFMVMPFVALRMHGVGHSSMTLIGATIGFGPLVSLAIGFYVGHLSDHWGRRRLVIAAMSLWVFVFLGFAFATQAIEFALLMALHGLARGIFDPISAAVVSDLCNEADPSGEQKKNAFHLRYFAINVGAAIGPLIGGAVLIASPKAGFLITSAIYATSVAFFIYFSRRWGLAALEHRRKKTGSQSFLQVMEILSRDRILQFYLLAFGCINLAISQMDTTFAVYLKELFNQNGVVLYSKTIALNGFLVICLTMPLLAWTKRFHLNYTCAVSSFIWAVGYLCLAHAHVPVHFYFAILLLTFGEIIVFANGYLIIESLAPENMKGAYLGSANFSNVGMALGPSLGGWLYEMGSGRLLFTVMSGFLFAAMLMYLWAKRSMEGQAALAYSGG